MSDEKEIFTLAQARKLLTDRMDELERTSKVLSEEGKMEHWNRICEARFILTALEKLAR
jgi:hypothetical protein